MYNFLDSHNAATAKTLRIKPGMYEGLKLRFDINQAAASQVALADLGELVLTYHGKQKWLINFTEIAILNAYKYGVREDVDAGAGLVHTIDFFIPLVHWLDPFSTVWIEDDTTAFLQWNPAATLAALVDTLTLRLTGKERVGVMTHILGLNRVDIAMVSGTTRPETIRPFNISNLFVEYDTDISLVQLDVDNKTEVQNMQAVELLNQTLLDNRVETYATAGQYFEIDFLATRQWDTAALARGLNSNVQLTLTGSGADTISVFNAYLDFQINEMARTQALDQIRMDKVLANKAATGGSASIAAYGAAKKRFEILE
jgi:hypothetical protein